MITWEQLSVLVEKGMFSLKMEPFDLVIGRDDFESTPDFGLTESVDNACRHFAHHQEWPEGIFANEKRAVVQRMLLAFFIVRTMQISLNARPTTLGKKPPQPEIELRLVLEWLLIWAWKAGGPKLMPHYRSVLFNVLDYAGMTGGCSIAG
jgi:hypothetical protein